MPHLYQVIIIVDNPSVSCDVRLKCPFFQTVKTDKLWIGLNDLKTTMFFEWSDHSSVPFVSWEINEPSHNADNEEDCVLIKGEVGASASQTLLVTRNSAHSLSRVYSGT